MGKRNKRRDRICQAVINAMKTMKQWEAIESDRGIQVSEGESHVEAGRESIPGRGAGSYKGPFVGVCLAYS